MVGTARDQDSLVQEASHERKSLRTVISLLYDSDMERRLIAAIALGKIAKQNPQIIKNKWSRIFHSFDDTMSCWGAAEGLGEIARNIPDLRSKILMLLRKFRKDEVSCQGYIWAVCRIGQVDRKMIRHFLADLIEMLDSDEVCMVGQTLWAIGELRIMGLTARIRHFVHDERETHYYENDSVGFKSVGGIAADALHKMNKQ